MTTGRMLCALSFVTTPNWAHNLKTLLERLNMLPNGTIAVASEVCLTDFAYDNFDAAALFGQEALPKLLEATAEKTLLFTLIESTPQGMQNSAYLLHNGCVIHKQPKHKLFTLGDERRYFIPGDAHALRLVEIDGLKIGILICFELRFTHLWEQLKGADLICIPARWGSARREHFVTLSKALAIANQCYVIACDAHNPDCTQWHAVISPFGETYAQTDDAPILAPLDLKLLAKMRRYIDIGFF